MNFIYKITNKINGKVYIGQTRYTIQQRWSQHISVAFSDKNKKDYNFLLHKAIRKYGKENFIIEQIEEVADESKLSEREQYWISFYGSCILSDGEEIGYNMTYGGEGSSKIDKIQVLKLWDEGLGSVEISNKLKNAASSIKGILESYENYDKEIDFSRNNGIKVYQYTEEGQLINSYPSISCAARNVNIDPSCISRCCSGNKKSAAGYFWSYSPDAFFESQKLNTWKKYSVIQLSLKGDFVAKYDSLSAAARAMNKKKSQQIKECCENKRKDMYGFIWMYEDNFVDDLAVKAKI